MSDSPGNQSDAVTDGIRVQVESQYVAKQSRPDLGRYVFAYHVRISNESCEERVQLKSRHWIIEDQMGEIEDVKGPGVVGEQPALAKGASFEYTSGAVLPTPRGSMRGTYFFERADGSALPVAIGQFELAMPFSLN